MPVDPTTPEPAAPAGGMVTAALRPVAVIDESIREAFLLLDALDRRTLGSLSAPLTCAQFHALAALELHPGQTLSALAARLLCAKANASGLVDRLSGMRLVRKEPDPDDGRCIRLSLTRAGTELLATARRARHDALTAELTALRTPHDLPLDELAVMMRRMVEHLRATSGAATVPARAMRGPANPANPAKERAAHARPAK